MPDKKGRLAISSMNGDGRVFGLRLVVVTLAMALVGAVLAPSSRAQGFQGIWDNPDGHLGLACARKSEDGSRQGAVQPDRDLDDLRRMAFLPHAKAEAGSPEAVRSGNGKAAKEGKAFNDVTGHCWPPGMPIMMTRVWPIQMIQLNTAIVMISNFENQVRWVFMDGRKHTDPDIYVPSYNGESIGHWEGNTLVIDTTNIETRKHFIDRSIPISDKFHVVERITLKDNGNVLSDEYPHDRPRELGRRVGFDQDLSPPEQGRFSGSALSARSGSGYTGDIRSVQRESRTGQIGDGSKPRTIKKGRRCSEQHLRPDLFAPGLAKPSRRKPAADWCSALHHYQRSCREPCRGP